MKDLTGKRVLLTGAGSGIGRSLALEFAKAKAKLCLLDVDPSTLNEVADEARSMGVSVVPEQVDLARLEQIPASIERALSHFGGFDVLVNNAGVAYYGPTENMTAAQWDWLLNINLLAPIKITRQLLPCMLELPEAHILNVCSISGLVAAGRFCAYHVSKFGLVGFSEALRAEYVRRGVGVTALCPGPVSTNLYNAAVSGRSERKVPNPPRWLCATPDQVARKGISAIRRNKGMVLVTPMAHLLWRAKRLAPGLLDALNRVTRKRRRPPAPVLRTGCEVDPAQALAGPHLSQAPVVGDRVSGGSNGLRG